MTPPPKFSLTLTLPPCCLARLMYDLTSQVSCFPRGDPAQSWLSAMSWSKSLLCIRWRHSFRLMIGTETWKHHKMWIHVTSSLILWQFLTETKTWKHKKIWIYVTSSSILWQILIGTETWKKIKIKIHVTLSSILSELLIETET